MNESVSEVLRKFYWKDEKPHDESEELVVEEQRALDEGDVVEAERLDPRMNIAVSVKRSRDSPPPEENPQQKRRVDAVEVGSSSPLPMETSPEFRKLHVRMKQKQKKK